MDKFEENILFFVHDTFFYKDIIDSLPMCLAAINNEGKIYYVNKTWKDFFEKFADLGDSDFYGEDLAILFEELFLDRNVSDVISRLKDAINSQESKQEIVFEVLMDNELTRLKVIVFTLYGAKENKELEEARDQCDKIVLFEKENKKIN